MLKLLNENGVEVRKWPPPSFSGPLTQNSEQAVNNGNLKPFKKGQSGNPGGRPKEVAEVKALARKQTTIAINTLVSIAKSKNATDAARVSACVALLDRGWGKPDKTHHHDGDIRQHIISDRPLTLDEWTTKYCRA